MLLLSIISMMLISSVTVILYVNHFTAMTEKQTRKSAFKNKVRKRISSVSSAQIENQTLLEDVA